ncbi:MAG TPA: TolC family protein [Gemmatimonadaceae bacterium]|nr:TolC family protein [Gemmatimonadaceae bacterium]
MRSLRLVAFLAIPAQVVVAQQTPYTGHALTLDQAVQIAHRNNPAFRQVENNLRNSESQVRQAYAALLPSSSTNFSARYQQAGTQYFQGVPIPGSADTYQSSYAIGLSYNISGAVAFAPRAARANRDAAEADISSQGEALRSQVTSQYITALQQQAQAALQDTLVQTAQGQLDLANAKLKVGAGTILDVRSAEVALGQAQVNALTAHSQAVIEKLKLFQLMGIPADTTTALTTTFTVTAPPGSLDSLIALAEHVNPDLEAKKARQFASQMQVNSAKTEYLPSLSISTGWGGNSFSYASSDYVVNSAIAAQVRNYNSCIAFDSVRVGAGLSPSNCGSPTLSAEEISARRASNNGFPFKFNRSPFGVSATLSLPIFNNYAREAQIEQAKVQRDNAAYDLRARNLQVTTDVTQAYLTLVTAQRTVELQTQNAQKATEELSFAQESYKVGAKTFLDVTNARGQYEQAQVARVNAIYDYHKAFAALENAVGRPLR